LSTCWKKCLRWLGVAFAFPVGALLGFCGAGSLCAGILALKGTGHSGDNAITIGAIGIMGFLVGGALLPWGVWRLTQPAASSDNGNLSRLGSVCLLILGCISVYIGTHGLARTSPGNWYAIAVVIAGIGMLLIPIYQRLRAARSEK
jgi:peptidoglycan/LPS O-acetylase OafA/YrhL